ncbi:MAG: DUF4838 domain-containing protein [Bacillota bacterium]|nr:DUF4838 domain-containing protein [Bacillota bacterium]
MAAQMKHASADTIIQFAKHELNRYRALMQAADPAKGSTLRSSIEVGLFHDLLPGRPVPENPFDDEIVIDVQKGSGLVVGANPRSCLLAVYRLLQEAGCRFLRPGPDGEMIPQTDWQKLNVQIDEKPSYRHRGICIEGAVSREVFLNILDWIPKNGMNAYFIQFREGFTFFDRWYDHKSNPFVPSEAKTIDEVRQIMAEGIEAIHKRGLIYHAVGHGWTCEPFGIPGLAWETVTDIPEEANQYFAEIDGKRELYRGIPLNTNLCYGNPKVRDVIVDGIVDYAKEHSETDLIHFWLADGSNNQCECPLCRNTRPADFYVAMLNQLDEALTRHNLPHRIVFLIYVDLLWQPEKEFIKNPDRFVLMFAPITRTYSQPFKPGDEQPVLPPYVRNQLTFPKSASENLAFLKPWQKLAGGRQGDSFDFDYHMMWDHYKDPGYEILAEVLHADLQNLAEFNLNGLISCQVQRLFFPSPLLMMVMARTLWNRNHDLESISADTYQAAFGPDWKKVQTWLREISRLFNPPWLRLELPLVDPEQAARLTGIAPLVAEFVETIRGNRSVADPCQQRSWRLLDYFGEYVLSLADFCQALAGGDAIQAEKKLDAVIQWVFKHESELLFVFDCEIMVKVFKGILKKLTPDSEQ